MCNVTPPVDVWGGAAVQTAEYFTDRTDVQCLHRWQKVLNPALVKGPWTEEVRPAFFWLDSLAASSVVLRRFTRIQSTSMKLAGS
jgi:hypothetical protein